VSWDHCIYVHYTNLSTDAASVEGESSTAENGSPPPSDNDDDHPSAPASSVSSDDYDDSASASESDEIVSSLEVIKVQCRSGPEEEPYAYVGSILAPKDLVHPRALTQSGFRVIGNAREFWHAVPLATVRLNVEKRSSRELVERIVALSEEHFEKGKCVSLWQREPWPCLVGFGSFGTYPVMDPCLVVTLTWPHVSGHDELSMTRY